MKRLKRHLPILLLVAGVLAVEYMILVHNPWMQDQESLRASADPGDLGLMVLATHLREKGVHVVSLQRTLHHSIRTGVLGQGTLVIPRPVQDVTDWDWKRLAEWVDAGGRVICLGWNGNYLSRARTALHEHVLHPGPVEMAQEVAKPSDAGSVLRWIFSGVSDSSQVRVDTLEVSMPGRSLDAARLTLESRVLSAISYIPLRSVTGWITLQRGHRVYAHRRVFGKGLFEVLLMPDALSNRFLLEHPEWFTFAVDFLFNQPGASAQTIYIDDYHQGISSTSSLGRVLREHGILWPLGGLALSLLGFFLFRGWNVAPSPSPLPAKAPGSEEAFATLAAFYLHNGMHHNFLRKRLEARGISPADRSALESLLSSRKSGRRSQAALVNAVTRIEKERTSEKSGGAVRQAQG